MKWFVLIVGVAAVLLGGLWLLQGLGIVQIPPILCVAECEAIEGSSTTWAWVGGVTLLAGLIAAVYAVRRL